jgi:hypothetical protein
VPGRSRRLYVPSPAVVALRPPGIAVTVAPAIGWPSFASLTTPWTSPLGTMS